MSSASLEIRELGVDYGSTRALDRFTLDVVAGERVAIVGPSGSGKSTLLRAVAGLETPARGSVHLDGQDLGAAPTHERNLGLMFQDNALFPHLDVAANVAYGLKMAGWDRGRAQRRVDELLELVGLTRFGGRSVDQLSGGEAQRVALARALAPEPGLLMLDEPLGSLDRALREELTGELTDLLGRLGVTTLHVTHDQAEAFRIGDRVAVMFDGVLHQVGTAEELWFGPVSARVARFLGHHNLWHGRLVPETAIISVDDPSVGSWEATVGSVSFSQGRYQAEAMIDRGRLPDPGPGSGLEVAGRSVRFTSSRPLAPGQVVGLVVDGTAVVEVDS